MPDIMEFLKATSALRNSAVGKYIPGRAHFVPFESAGPTTGRSSHRSARTAHPADTQSSRPGAAPRSQR
jgi:hypothetical protein